MYLISNKCHTSEHISWKTASETSVHRGSAGHIHLDRRLQSADAMKQYFTDKRVPDVNDNVRQGKCIYYILLWNDKILIMTQCRF